MTASPQPFAVQAGEGRPLRTPAGDTAVVKVDTQRSGGALTVVELRIQPKSGPALHAHSREDELWCVLEGEFRFKAGDALFRASTGGMAFGPRGTPHCFQNVGDSPGRLLVITTPSGLETFFEESEARFSALADPDVLADLWHASGLEFLGPPLGVSDPLE